MDASYLYQQVRDLLVRKGADIKALCFVGLDGTNTMSGEKVVSKEESDMGPPSASISTVDATD